MQARKIFSQLPNFFVAVSFIFFCLSACSPVKLFDRKNINGFNLQTKVEAKKNDHMDLTGQSNFEILKANFGSTEWQLNKRDRSQPPFLGIAMSGGGMRSAAFNIGIMKGLHAIGILDKVDVMSAVSGGSYAMSWYFMQKYYSQAEDERLFEGSGDYQRHLFEHARMPVHSDQAVLEYPEYGVKLVSNILVLPLHWFSNGLFDWNLNLAPYRKYYQNAIERTFHISPCDSDDCYRNASTFLGKLVNVESTEKVKFSDMQYFLMSDKKLPSFIINTTVKIDVDDRAHRAANLCNSIFEFTPFRFGSDSFGYRTVPDHCNKKNGCPIDMHMAVAISGAAVDSSIMPAKLQGLNDVINLNLGYSIANYNLKTSQRVKHNMLPFPFYYAYRDKYDIRGSAIYLTDGGHSENLGAFSLIKRMCRNIIIVDAEYDPNYNFTAYRKLKKRLKSEFGVTLCVKELEPENSEIFDLKSNRQIFDDELSEEIIDRLDLSRTTAPKVKYMESIGDTWSIEDTALNKKYLAVVKDGELIIKAKYSGINPVMKGKVSWFPLGGHHQTPSKKIKINVIYVKLSLRLNDDGDISSDYPQSIRNYYHDKGKHKKKFIFWKASSFPHENTSDISYGEDQFKAYRDLGDYIIKANRAYFEDVDS